MSFFLATRPRVKVICSRVTIVEEFDVEELTAIVGIQPQERNRQQIRTRSSATITACWLRYKSGRHSVQPVATSVRTSVCRKALRPWATMRDEIGLKETRTDVIPTGEGAHRHLLFDEQPASRGRHAVRSVPFAIRAEEAIGGRRTEREELRPPVGQRQMATAFECRHQLRQKGDEALGADAIGRRPRDDERVLHGDSIEALTRTGKRQGYGNGMGKEPDSVLARVAGDGDELVEDD